MTAMPSAWEPGRACGLSSSSLRFVSEVADLAAIFEPGVNVVALQRTPSPELVREAQRALARGLRMALTVATDGAARVLPRELRGFPSLSADLELWVEVLAGVTGSERVGVRLTRVEAAMCPRLHVDRVTVRVVGTYQGRGTEFVSSEHLDRARLGHASLGATDETSGLLLARDCVREAEPFDILLLKGDAWPENTGRGAVHRSPPASMEAPRLVMTLDPL